MLLYFFWCWKLQMEKKNILLLLLLFYFFLVDKLLHHHQQQQQEKEMKFRSENSKVFRSRFIISSLPILYLL